MKILFKDEASLNKGSTRIWIYNLFNWMEEKGYNVQLNKDIDDDTNVVIFGKSTPFKDVSKIREKFPHVKIGIINPSDAKRQNKSKLAIADFYITGSIEERDYYLGYNKNTFIFPLIEDIYKNQKEHTDKDELVLSYHGNKHHLEQFKPNLTNALNKIALKRRIKLIAIYDIKNTGKWKTGRPNIEIEDIQWDIKTIEKELLRSDIGLVTGLNPISKRHKMFIRKFFQLIDFNQTRFVNDYIIEFKNTTNAGRTFVYHQLGIPVISDILPSSFHILADENNGFIAHSTAGWIKAIEFLGFSAERRNQVAKNAKKSFDIYYNPLEWTEKLYNQIIELFDK